MSWTIIGTLAAVRGGIVALVRHSAGAVGLGRRWRRRHRSIPSSRLTRKYQALLAPLPPPAVQATGGDGWPATWRGVARAAHARQLLTALVVTPDGPRPPDGSPLTVTMTVVGPGDCLDVGDDFTLWQGGDIARGVVTRRLFV